MTVIPFPKKPEPQAQVPAAAPSPQQVNRGRAVHLMRELIMEMQKVGVVFPDKETTVKDSLLITETINAFLARLDGFDHPFHPLSDNAFVFLEDGQIAFNPPEITYEEVSENSDS